MGCGRYGQHELLDFVPTNPGLRSDTPTVACAHPRLRAHIVPTRARGWMGKISCAATCLALWIRARRASCSPTRCCRSVRAHTESESHSEIGLPTDRPNAD